MHSAYCGPAPLPGALPWSWNFDPILIAALVVLWFLWPRNAASTWGAALLAIIFVTPICALSAGLFSARSIHHVLTVLVAAPVLALAKPKLPNVPLSGALLFHVLIFWAWHIPGLYLWALSSHAAYWLGQIALIGSAVLFWNALFRRTTSVPGLFFALIAMAMQMGFLGAIITFAPQAVYAPHFATASLYGLTPLEDQQLAGLIMWVASLPLTFAAAWPALRCHLQELKREAAA